MAEEQKPSVGLPKTEMSHFCLGKVCNAVVMKCYEICYDIMNRIALLTFNSVSIDCKTARVVLMGCNSYMKIFFSFFVP